MYSNIIIIPVYKECPSRYEILSFIQCCKILNNHPICLLTYPELNCSRYINIAKNCGLELQRANFPKKNFESISGYNQLMLSKDLYKRFLAYDYMLIYQLDAYVFKDELNFWCEKNYDYIGAPWGKNCGKMIIDEIKYWAVGNGGFSLRKTKFFYSVFSRRLSFSFASLSLVYRNYKYKWFYIFVKYLGYRNTMKYLIDKKYKFINEDIFISCILKKYNISISIPTPLEAMKFAFETSPEVLYSLSDYVLPFGCHAWEKPENIRFWSSFIK